MQYYCQQSPLRHLYFYSSKFYNFSQRRFEMSESKGGSRPVYREKKETEAHSSSSDSDDDEQGAAADYKKPTPEKSKFQLENLQRYFKQTLGLSSDDDGDKSSQVLKSLDFQGLIDHWKEKGFKKIITMVGAGISTSAGIPDFRSPKTGLYHNLQKYDLPYPTAVFEIAYFRKKPQPFFELAKELYPGQFYPTPCHYFVRLLHEKGLLLRHYTQNIDTLEHIAGIPAEKLVEAHGTFRTNHCIGCYREYSMEWVKEQIFADSVPTCDECNKVVKPDIVFFGEDLPRKFYTLPEKDFKQCDLLIIMGTSLEVQPFANLINRPKKHCVRLLINRELVGTPSRYDLIFGTDPLMVGKKDNKRDVAWLGDCDDGVMELANQVGLGDELKELIEREHKKIDEANKKSSAKNKTEESGKLTKSTEADAKPESKSSTDEPQTSDTKDQTKDQPK